MADVALELTVEPEASLQEPVEKGARWTGQKIHAFGVGRGGARDRTIDACTVLTEPKRKLIVKFIAGGANVANAARLVQIRPVTVQHGIDRGAIDVAECEGTNLPMTVLGQFHLDVVQAQAAFQTKLQAEFKANMKKEPKAAVAYLELLGRLHPTELGRRQVVKVEQDTTLRIAFVEKTGEEWQRGQSRVSEGSGMSGQRAIAGTVSEGNEIIDAELRASDDDE